MLTGSPTLQTTITTVSVVALVLAACGGTGRARTEDTTSPAPDREPAATTTIGSVQQVESVDGAWVRDGYGQVFTVSDGVTTGAWMPAGRWCAEIPGEVSDLSITLTGPDTAMIIGEPQVALSRTELPSSCTDDPSPPRATIEAFVTIMDTYYPFFDERQIDWEQERESLLASADTVATSHEAGVIVADFIASLGDDHTSIDVEATVDSVDDSEQLSLRDRALELARIDALLGTSRTETAGGLLVHGELLPGVGYLAIRQMIGYSPDGIDEVDHFARALDEALADLQTSERLVIDVRGNGGGTDEVSLEAISRFVDEPVDLYTKEAYAEPSTRRTVTATPSDSVRYGGEVVVLVDGTTASATEIFAAGMRRVGADTVGTPTAGIFSDINSAALPGGFELEMSSEVYRDLDGQTLEVRGVPLTTTTEATATFEAAFRDDEWTAIESRPLSDRARSDALSDAKLLRVRHGPTCRAIITLEIGDLGDRASEVCDDVFSRVIDRVDADDLARLIDASADAEPVLLEAFVEVVDEARTN